MACPAVTRRLIEEFLAPPARRDPATTLPGLTNREAELVALAARGPPDDAIAAHLVISAATVKTHLSRAMTKLGARDRAQLVVFAYESGLVTPARRNP